MITEHGFNYLQRTIAFPHIPAVSVLAQMKVLIPEQQSPHTYLKWDYTQNPPNKRPLLHITRFPVVHGI
jgi:hypothetical protein